MSGDAGIIAIVAVVILLAMIIAQQPIWAALASAGGIGLLLLSGFNVASAAVGASPFNATSNYVLVVIPMYIIMGALAQRAGIAADIFAVAEKASHRLPGGLGVATILACGGFAAITGSSSATVAAIGRIAVEQMMQRGYKPNSAGALVAIGGTLGVLIPPSIIIVVYASLTGESIGRLLLACAGPAVLTILAYSVAVIIRYRQGKMTIPGVVERRGSAGKATGSVGSSGATAVITAPTKIKVSRRNIIGTAYVAVLFLTVVGGTYSGLFTATESGAVAAGVAAIILIVRVRKEGLRGIGRGLRDAAIDSGSSTAMVFALLTGGTIFAFFLVKTGLPNLLVRTIAAAELPAIAVVIVALLIMIVLGCFLDSLSIMVITIPLMFPVLLAVGADPIWFGLLTVKAIEIGLVTPPFGINVFVAASTSSKTTPEGIFREVLPLVIAEFIVIAILIAAPPIVTFLPDLVFGAR